MSVLEWFCAVDDFILKFAPQWKANQLAARQERIPSSGQLPALCGFDWTHGAPVARLFAEPLWDLHRGQLHLETSLEVCAPKRIGPHRVFA